MRATALMLSVWGGLPLPHLIFCICWKRLTIEQRRLVLLLMRELVGETE